METLQTLQFVTASIRPRGRLQTLLWGGRVQPVLRRGVTAEKSFGFYQPLHRQYRLHDHLATWNRPSGLTVTYIALPDDPGTEPPREFGALQYYNQRRGGSSWLIVQRYNSEHYG